MCTILVFSQEPREMPPPSREKRPQGRAVTFHVAVNQDVLLPRHWLCMTGSRAWHLRIRLALLYKRLSGDETSAGKSEMEIFWPEGNTSLSPVTSLCGFQFVSWWPSVSDELSPKGHKEVSRSFRDVPQWRCIWKVLSHFSCVWLFVTPWTMPHWLLCPWAYLGKNTRVGCHFLLQGIFLTQGSNRMTCGFFIAGGFYTIWATREGCIYTHTYIICSFSDFFTV